MCNLLMLTAFSGQVEKLRAEVTGEVGASVGIFNLNDEHNLREVSDAAVLCCGNWISLR